MMKWSLAAMLIAIVFLSQDYWNWSENSNLEIFGFPYVVVYFFGLQLFLAVVIWVFSVKFWRESE